MEQTVYTPLCTSLSVRPKVFNFFSFKLLAYSKDLVFKQTIKPYQKKANEKQNWGTTPTHSSSITFYRSIFILRPPSLTLQPPVL